MRRNIQQGLRLIEQLRRFAVSMRLISHGFGRGYEGTLGDGVGEGGNRSRHFLNVRCVGEDFQGLLEGVEFVFADEDADAFAVVDFDSSFFAADSFVKFEEACLNLIDCYETETTVIIHSSNSRDTVFPDLSQI